MHTGICGNTCGQIYHASGRRKFKHKSLCTGIQRMWNIKCMIIPVKTVATHRKSNKGFKENFENHTRKTFNRFTTNDSHAWNITHHNRKYYSVKLEPY